MCIGIRIHICIYTYTEREKNRGRAAAGQHESEGGRATESRAKPPPRPKTDFPEGGSNPASGFSKGGRVGGPSTDPGKRRPFGQTGPRDPRGRPDYRKANWEATGGFFPRGATRPGGTRGPKNRRTSRRSPYSLPSARAASPPEPPTPLRQNDPLTPFLRGGRPKDLVQNIRRGAAPLTRRAKKEAIRRDAPMFLHIRAPGCVDSAPLENNFTDPLQNKTF